MTVWRHFLLSENTLVKTYLREFLDGSTEKHLPAAYPRAAIQREIAERDHVQIKNFSDLFISHVAASGKYLPGFVTRRFRESADQVFKELLR